MKTKILSLALVTCAILNTNIFSQAEVKLNGPEISVDKETHDYGEIEQYGDGVCFFTITNTGNEPLVITKAKGSCGCTVPDWPKEAIAPGKSAKMSVKYNTQKKGEIKRSVTISSNASNTPIKIVRVKGNVVAPKSAVHKEPTLLDS